MENNQEHKIDKIFRETFENQEITPPSDAWMGIHTYTIGQEEKKPKVWLKYASLTILLLLISGFGLWYFVDNQEIINTDASTLLSHKEVNGGADNGMNNAGRVQNPASVKNGEELSSPIVGFTIHPLVRKQTLPNNISSHSKQMLTLLTTQVDWSGDQPRDDSLSNQNIELIEPVNYLEDNKVEIIEPKPLIVNDLADKIQKENESKIVALEERIDDKKEIFKVDSVSYGGRFSLKHPIITLGIFGTGWNFWNFSEEQIGKTFYPNKRFATVKIGVSWKINSKLRVGLSLGTSNCDLGVPVVNVLPQSSYTAGVNGKLIQINSDQYYQAETPFGGIKIPTSQFKDLPFRNPNILDSTILLTYYGILPHSIQATTFSINSQFDFLSIQRKNKKKYNYQVYGLLDFNIQRQSRYYFNASVPYLISINGKYEQRSLLVYAQGDHLQNASEFVFGLQAGLGFRYQFGRKWDFFVEGSGQHSLNNWVKSDDIKTYQRALSLQAGINVNL